MAKRPMSPVARTCVPPHSSRLKPGIDTTRTRSPYFSPNSAMAPAAIASCVAFTSVTHRRVPQHLLVDDVLDLDAAARGVSGAEVDEVEAQSIGRHQRARLLDVRAEHLAQRGVQQMRRRVIAPRRVAHGRGDVGRDEVALAAAYPCVTSHRVQSRPAGDARCTP